MAMASATLSPSITACSAAAAATTRRRMKKEVCVGGFNSFGGLKAQNGVVSLGLPLSADQCFAKMVNSMRATASSGKGKGKRGGALSSTCNAAGEIFQIAAIMNGLVLIGVAVGFVLLRIEAWLEESEA
ncbi:uncharacterized protein LOC129318538 [Prosopis cineraria]|uniref:uncharacterized protein LOC129318538 n=1 Tax=Prosopis cineraria TaxID=364024 RepID=UPI0024105C87|nr:uncharacterized protein LOC129318538 [Prosopis cineraria]